jgi:hypothetical protein
LKFDIKKKPEMEINDIFYINIEINSMGLNIEGVTRDHKVYVDRDKYGEK